jgi:hypothetical protein
MRIPHGLRAVNSTAIYETIRTNYHRSAIAPGNWAKEWEVMLDSLMARSSVYDRHLGWIRSPLLIGCIVSIFVNFSKNVVTSIMTSGT